MLVSAGLRAWPAWLIPAPWFSGDEVTYASLGRSLWEHGQLRILGAPTGFLSLVFPAIAGLPLSIGGVEHGYRALRVLEPLVMSLAAVPAWLWARSLGTGRWALAAAALTVAIPSLGYSGLIMTEVAFYPVATLAAWATWAAIVRPTRRNQALLVGAVALAALTRLQAIVLLPALVTAVVVEAALARRLARAFRLTLALGAFGVLAFLWIAWRLGSGGPWTGILGGYGSAAGGYELGASARYVLYHAGGLLILVGVVPFCAVASLLVGAVRRPEPDDGVRALLAVAASLSAWMVLQVGVFASNHGGKLEERYLIGLAPVYFVGFSVWLARGGPRPLFRTAWIAIAAVALVALLPLKTLITDDALGDSFVALALWRALQPDRYETVLLLGTAVAVALWALVPRRFLVVLPVALVAGLVLASVESSRETVAQARLQEQRLVGPDPRWIDHAADGPVAFLYDGDPYWTTVWENLFFNRRLKTVVDLPGTNVPGPLPQRVVRPAPDGTIAGLPRWVVAWDNTKLDGTPVAQAPLVNVTHGSLQLWRLRSPRIQERLVGLTPNGELTGGSVAGLTVYRCTTDGANVVMFAKEPLDAVLTLFNGDVRSIALRKGEIYSGTIPGPSNADGRGRCEFGIRSTGLLGVTQFTAAR